MGPYNSIFEPKARKWVGTKMVHDPWHHIKNYPSTPGESENQVRFYPGVPPLAILPPPLGGIPNWAFSSQNLGENAQIEGGSWPYRKRTCTWDQNENDLDRSRERENKNNFPLAVIIRQFSLRNSKIGLSPLILGQNVPNKNSGTARGKMTIYKMTARWMCIKMVWSSGSKTTLILTDF